MQDILILRTNIDTHQLFRSKIKFHIFNKLDVRLYYIDEVF